MPSDHSVDFDFTRKGVLVFADKSVANGNLSKSAIPRLPLLVPDLEVNEFNAVIQQMAKVKLMANGLNLLFH